MQINRDPHERPATETNWRFFPFFHTHTVGTNTTNGVCVCKNINQYRPTAENYNGNLMAFLLFFANTAGTNTTNGVSVYTNVKRE